VQRQELLHLANLRDAVYSPGYSVRPDVAGLLEVAAGGEAWTADDQIAALRKIPADEYPLASETLQAIVKDRGQYAGVREAAIRVIY
jgi:hypothetical protein